MNDDIRREAIPPRMRMAVGVAAAVLGVVPFTIRLFMLDLGNVTGLVFVGAIVATFLGLAAALTIHIAWVMYTDETSISCVIAQASLVPGSLNAVMFAVSAFLPS